MAEPKTQTYANHRRYVPLFHFVLAGILLANVVITGRHVYYQGITRHVMWEIVMALALVLIFLFMRAFPVAVQDRVIRLEETLRLQRLAPDLASRASEFTPEQFIGLRFASDEELPALARKVLDERIASRDAIKKMVKSWRGDFLRA